MYTLIRFTRYISKALFHTGFVYLLFSSNLLLSAQDFSVAPIFSDSMVLQQEDSVLIWGSGFQGRQISVLLQYRESGKCRIASISKTQVSPEGLWELKIKTPGNTGKYELHVIQFDDIIVLKNIQLGDVWMLNSPGVQKAKKRSSDKYDTCPGIRMANYTQTIEESDNKNAHSLAWISLTDSEYDPLSHLPQNQLETLCKGPSTVIGIILVDPEEAANCRFTVKGSL